jgi:preprotein translocase subunit SecF
MEFFRIKKDIPFMSYSHVTTTISLVTFVLAVVFLLLRGLNFSVEFTGGTVMEVQYQHAADLNDIRSRVDTLKLGDSTIQNLGSSSDVMIRLPTLHTKSAAELSNEVLNALRSGGQQVELRKVDFVGPQVGEELVQHGLIAISLVCVGIMLYLALRFEWRFAVSAIIANMHDVVIILGCFALFRWEFSLTVLAGVLAVLGYSVNESVVVFDRIRENFRKGSMRTRPVSEIIDNAITATMSRTIITHGSTECMVLSMLIFGGPALHGFATALTIGILFGIYSSVLVASPIVMWLGVSRENLVKPPKQKQEAVV